MKKTIQVNEELVNEVQLRDSEATVSRDILTQLIDAHKADIDTDFMESPVFKAYSKDVVEKKIAFDKAKDKMFDESVPEELKGKVKTWDLSYLTGVLTLEV